MNHFSKPIVRWTFGGCLRPEGYEALRVSIQNFDRIYSDRFAKYIMYNNCDANHVLDIASEFSIVAIEQKWSWCPIQHEYKSVVPDQSGKYFGGSMWKWCPPRLNIHLHELVIDNDLILLQPMDEIERFLQSTSPLIVADPLKFQGRYKHLLPNSQFNAGLMGLPPDYDIAKAMIGIWRENGKFNFLTQADEQGLVSAAIQVCNPIVISESDLVEVHPNGRPDEVVWDDAEEVNHMTLQPVIDFDSKGYHFVSLNRNHHPHWERFQRSLETRPISYSVQN
jgi:hypothetical protein